jgi:hypothetical protein
MQVAMSARPLSVSSIMASYAACRPAVRLASFFGSQQNRAAMVHYEFANSRTLRLNIVRRG